MTPGPAPHPPPSSQVLKLAQAEGINVRVIDAKTVGISFDETSSLADVDALLRSLNGGKAAPFTAASLAPSAAAGVGAFARSSKFLEHPVFNSYHDEHSMLRWACSAGGGSQHAQVGTEGGKVVKDVQV